jgi:diguanylate cyclase (GGDEF)-like protein
MRLSRLFLLFTGILLSLVLLMAARSVVQDWRLVRSAEAGLAAMQLTNLAMQVAEKASAERGPTIPVLNDRVPPDPARRERLNQARQVTDDAFTRAFEALHADPDSAPTGAAELLDRARLELVRARANVDRVAQLPEIDRTAPGSRLTREPIDQMFAVIDTVFSAVTLLSGAAERAHPDLAMPLVAARYSAELRENAGRLGSQFTSALATQRPLGERERRDIPLLEGRILQLAQLLDVQLKTHRMGEDPRIRAAMLELNTRYFGAGLPFIADMTQRGLSNGNYGLESGGFVARYVPEMRSIVQLRDTTFAVAREGAERAVAEARQRMWINLALAGLILLVELAVLFTIRFWVIRPLLSSTHAIRRVLRGESVRRLPAVRRTDELGDLQRAVAEVQALSEQQQQATQERSALIRELQHASTSDPLTGLANRRAFDERGTHLLAQARRHNWQIALVLFDCDHFKAINDRFGHAVGDAVLTQLAQIALTEFRQSDLLARYGGEEFIALASDLGPESADVMAERVRAAIEQTIFRAPDGLPMRITASFGVAVADAQAIEHVDQLFGTADKALYAAKSGGRNRVVVRAWTPSKKAV